MRFLYVSIFYCSRGYGSKNFILTPKLFNPFGEGIVLFTEPIYQQLRKQKRYNKKLRIIQLWKAWNHRSELALKKLGKENKKGMFSNFKFAVYDTHQEVITAVNGFEDTVINYVVDQFWDNIALPEFEETGAEYIVMQIRFCAKLKKLENPRWFNIGPYTAFKKDEKEKLKEFISLWVQNKAQEYLELGEFQFTHICCSLKMVEEDDSILKMKLRIDKPLNMNSQNKLNINEWATAIPHFWNLKLIEGAIIITSKFNPQFIYLSNVLIFKGNTWFNTTWEVKLIDDRTRTITIMNAHTNEWLLSFVDQIISAPDEDTVTFTRKLEDASIIQITGDKDIQNIGKIDNLTVCMEWRDSENGYSNGRCNDCSIYLKSKRLY